MEVNVWHPRERRRRGIVLAASSCGIPQPWGDIIGGNMPLLRRCGQGAADGLQRQAVGRAYLGQSRQSVKAPSF